MNMPRPNWKHQAEWLATENEQLKKRIEALETPHTDRHTPCPKCGHVITHVERKPLVVVDEGGEGE